jgi:hypothetical protein
MKKITLKQLLEARCLEEKRNASSNHVPHGAISLGKGE